MKNADDPPPFCNGKSFSLLSLVEIPEQFSLHTTLQSLLHNIHEDSLQQILDFLSPHLDSKLNDIVYIIAAFHDRRLHQSKLFLYLLLQIFLSYPLPVDIRIFTSLHPFLSFKLIQSKAIPPTDDSISSKLFRFLVFPSKRNVPICFSSLFKTQRKSFPIEDIRNAGYEGSSLGHFLKFDDFDRFQSSSTVSNFDFHAQISLSPFALPYDTEPIEEPPKLELLAFAGFHRSVNCFKFIFLNGAAISASVCDWSVKGGDEEILQICELEHSDFSNSLPAAVSYLRNDVADWLLASFPVSSFCFGDCFPPMNLPAIFFLISETSEVNEIPISSNHNALYHAVRVGWVEFTRMMLSFGADPTKCNSDDLFPLYPASSRGYIDVCEILIAHGAEVNQVDQISVSSIYIAAQEGQLMVCKLLIAHGADVHQADADNWFPLYIASRNNHLEICKLLVESHANVNQITDDGFTAVNIASQSGHLEICQYLISKGANVNKCSNGDFSPFYNAAGNGYFQICKLLISNGADFSKTIAHGFSPLHIAAANGHLDICKLLVSLCQNVNKVDGHRVTPLTVAAQEGKLEICKFLISVGADVHLCDIEEAGPLYAASSNGHSEICKILILNGADVNKRATDGRFPLYMASTQNDFELCELLISNGADQNKTAIEGKTALHIASSLGFLRICQLLVSSGADLHKRDNSRRTPLFYASENRRTEVCAFLKKAMSEHSIWLSSPNAFYSKTKQ